MGCTSSSLKESTTALKEAPTSDRLVTTTDDSAAGELVQSSSATGAGAEVHDVQEEPLNATLVEEPHVYEPKVTVSSSSSAAALPKPEEQTVLAPPVQLAKMPALKKGFILKEGHLVKNWKNRFFVLEAGIMTYYESSTDKPPYGVRKKGEMVLKGATAKVEKNNITISAEGDSAREGQSSLTLEIRYPTEREEWLQAIRAHIAYFSAADVK